MFYAKCESQMYLSIVYILNVKHCDIRKFELRSVVFLIYKTVKQTILSHNTAHRGRDLAPVLSTYHAFLGDQMVNVSDEVHNTVEVPRPGVQHFLGVLRL